MLDGRKKSVFLWKPVTCKPIAKPTSEERLPGRDFQGCQEATFLGAVSHTLTPSQVQKKNVFMDNTSQTGQIDNRFSLYDLDL